MKTMSATLMSLALVACPAAAEDAYQSTMSGTVKIEVVPKTAGEAQPKADETITIRFVRPPKPADEDPDDMRKNLSRCGEDWNRKLDVYEKNLAKHEKYAAYYEKWKSYPAQRPPKSQEPVLTRASYRSCMYACLGDTTSRCPK